MAKVYLDTDRGYTLERGDARRLGRFMLSERLMDATDGIYWPMVSELMKTVFIVRCESDFVTRAFIYTGVSPYFREIPQGQMMPYYRATFDNETGAIAWEETDEENFRMIVG